ncbi:MAG: putative metallopeptidase [Pantoea sp.]|uniref:putative metallopeptidase n=1 Tax=unclassified Pantoea TaxID=2630326 RepID=UPI0001B3FDD6
MYEQFGKVAEYIITLATDYYAGCIDVGFYALVEHELYHIAQKVDEFGAPECMHECQPKLTRC